ncbi:hypothetical protein [Haloplanus pelagicus]|jgi:hypothetical protein|uniref:hypothetical protein n=1 Tax=Haloplanus pelagicus TaxID=2949995 RepID=UPI00203AA5E6|nr:hypothetical protein [Haloplanus sp. HW8-1]
MSSQLTSPTGEPASAAEAEVTDRNAGTRLDSHLRDRGVAVAERELATALARLDDLSPAQRRIVASMAGRIVADVLAPAREAVDGDADSPVATEAVGRLFLPDEDVRDEG